MGITQKTLSDYRGYRCTAEQVQELTRAEATEIYHKNYWVDPGFFTLGRGVVFNDMLFDAGIHHGPGRAVKLLQAMLHLEQDGVLGPLTREAVNSMTDKHLCCNFMAARVSYIGKIITDNESQAVFAAGWANRLAGLIRMIPMA
jgi:lysozyme family protein